MNFQTNPTEPATISVFKYDSHVWKGVIYYKKPTRLTPYSLFLFSLKSKESRSKYAQRINRFFDIIEVPAGETADRCKVFFQNGQEDSKYVLNHVILFLQAQKEKVENKKLASGTVRNYVNTIKLVCEVCLSPFLGRKSCVDCLEDEG